MRPGWSSSLRLRRAKRYLTPYPLAPLLLRGTSIECPCCGGRWRHLLPMNGRPNAICPGCGSAERHRLLKVFMDRHLGSALERPVAVLHLAPELAIGWPLSRRPNIDYTSADIRPGAAMVEADVTAMPFADESFDLILCSHVLEHVPDDSRAMRELHRLLRPDGNAVLQHPIDSGLAETYEDPSITDPAEREREFGQDDHVRVYGADHRDRLEQAGFAVQVFTPDDLVDAETAKRIALGDAEEAGDVYVCSR